MTGGLFNGSTKGATVDTKSFLDSHIPERIAELLDMGVLVSLGTTRDRGAISITVTRDGEFDREYFRDSVEASEYLQRAADAIRAMIGAPELHDPTTVHKTTRRRSRLA
jgi:hypothetical protein